MNQVKDPIINYLSDQTINWDYSNRKQKVRKAKTNSNFQIHSFREGLKKKQKAIMENSIMGLDPPSPLVMEKKFNFFSETRPFFENFL